MAKGETYEQFVEKFKPKKTTDDCYTPADVYESVTEFFTEKLLKPAGYTKEDIIRPFYPGGDYEAEDYTGRVVVDNPPFSILMRIVRFYNSKGVPFVLFCDTRYALHYVKEGCSCYVTDTTIKYENGAKVPTSFITNMKTPAPLMTRFRLDWGISHCYSQSKTIAVKNIYPPNILTISEIQKIAKSNTNDYNINIPVEFISKVGKTVIFGGALVISERARKEIEKIKEQVFYEKEELLRERSLKIEVDDKTAAIIEKVEKLEALHH